MSGLERDNGLFLVATRGRGPGFSLADCTSSLNSVGVPGAELLRPRRARFDVASMIGANRRGVIGEASARRDGPPLDAIFAPGVLRFGSRFATRETNVGEKVATRHYTHLTYKINPLANLIYFNVHDRAHFSSTLPSE